MVSHGAGLSGVDPYKRAQAVAVEHASSQQVSIAPEMITTTVFRKGRVRQVFSLAEGSPVQLSEALAEGETLTLELQLRTTWLGRWIDPYVDIGEDRQDFERGVCGRRYFNLSGQRDALQRGCLIVRRRFCRLPARGQLYVLANPDYSRHRFMVLAPHADDAELAAFGLYSGSKDVSIATLTQGEIEAQGYESLSLSKNQAARLKGRLRSWDSLATPLWDGVVASRCVQLGYYCLQLPRWPLIRLKPAARVSLGRRISAVCESTIR
jgi:hypothetical protein